MEIHLNFLPQIMIAYGCGFTLTHGHFASSRTLAGKSRNLCLVHIVSIKNRSYFTEIMLMANECVVTLRFNVIENKIKLFYVSYLVIKRNIRKSFTHRLLMACKYVLTGPYIICVSLMK